MKSAHPNLNALQDLEKYVKKKILFISEETPSRSKLYEWIPIKPLGQFFYQGIKAIDMAMEVFKRKGYDVVFIFEHKPWYSFLLYLACILKRKPTFFIIHGIQQTYTISTARKIGFKMLLFVEKHFKFWPVHLEASDEGFTEILRFKKSGIVMQIPFPKEMQAVFKKRNMNDAIKIGIVGILRPDKPIMPILNVLLNYKNDSTLTEISVGTPLWQLPEEMKKLPVRYEDTARGDQYNAFIQTLDIVITYYDKAGFYHRSSGVINDSVGGGCFVVAPDYPVLKVQITNPVKVGETYSGLDDIKGAIDRSIEYIKNNDVEFEKWRDFRSNENIVKNLAMQMLAVLNK